MGALNDAIAAGDLEEARRAFWARAEAAAKEVATWPWWKRGDPAPPEELPEELPVHEEDDGVVLKYDVTA